MSSSTAAASSSSNGFVSGEVQREKALTSEVAQRLIQRDAPARRRARMRSRSALDSASRAQLLQAGRRHFPDFFSGPLFDGRHPGPQMTVVGYRGDRSALVQDGRGRRLLLKSTLPLQASAANGELAPVDLSLRESAETFTTANSNTDVQIFKDPARGIHFLGKGFSVASVMPPAPAQSGGVEADGRVFFDDVGGNGSDVSFVAVPKPNGVQVGWLLATADAPETYTLKLDLPVGARLRRTHADDPIPGHSPRTFEIIGHDARPVAHITPPMTVDSDGVNVPSSMRIVGRDRLVVDVQHHGKDLRFPLFVDPSVTAWSGGTGGWKGWNGYQVPTTPTRVGSDYNHNLYGLAVDHPAYYPDGAYMVMPQNTFFDMGTSVGFEFRARAGSYVWGAMFGNMSHRAIWPTGNHNMWWQGILNPARTAWQHMWSGFHSAFGITHHFEGGSGDQNFANIGIGATAPNWGGYLWSGSNYAALTIDWANVYIADPNPPQLSSPRPVDRRWSTTTTGSQRVSASDHGTGLVAFRLTGRGIDTTTYSTAIACHTIYTNFEYACPADQTITKDVPYTPAEGSHTYTLTAIDAAGNTSTPHTWTEMIDRTPPQAVSRATAAFDPAESEIDVSWPEPTDFLQDGSPGSGIAKYRSRYLRSGTWSAWTEGEDPVFTIDSGYDGEPLTVQLQPVDAVALAGAVKEFDLVAGVQPDDYDLGEDPSETSELGTAEPEMEGDADGGSEARAASEADELLSCGRNRYQRNPQDTFRVKFSHRGTTNGDAYYQYHLHYQVRQPFRENVARTTLRATRTLPNGSTNVAFDDSNTRIGRPGEFKPYYAHFIRLKVKPGTVISYSGHWTYKVPVPLGGGREQTGGRYNGRCRATLG